MEIQRAVDLLQRQSWLGPAGDYLKRFATTVYSGGGAGKRLLRNSLYGTWLGHPAHPMIVTVPAGAWVTAALLDLCDARSDPDGGDRFGKAADTTIALGLGTALLAAASGLNDWRFTELDAQRVGTLHGLTNVVAVTLMGTSALLRWRGARSAGRIVSSGGLLLTAGAAYLGGHLVGHEGIGVDHSSTAGIKKEFTRVVALSDLAEGTLHEASAGETQIVLLRRGDHVYALADNCSHLGGPLHEGELSDDCVTCPWHGSRFSMVDGRVIDGPASYPQPALETRIQAGQVEVRLPARER
jgi:nitrite reductase/ring-hydroxylating ferredoxin subunit/uncharacterized membrane protein